MRSSTPVSIAHQGDTLRFYSVPFRHVDVIFSAMYSVPFRHEAVHTARLQVEPVNCWQRLAVGLKRPGSTHAVDTKLFGSLVGAAQLCARMSGGVSVPLAYPLLHVQRG